MWAPLVDIHRTENDIVVRAELPVVKPDEVDISAEGHTLTLQGEKKAYSEIKEEDYYRMEQR